ELELAALSAETVAFVAEIAILDPRVTGERLTRLAHVAHYTTGHTLTPLPETTANWVEKFATHLQVRGVSIKTWDEFYQDLAALFSGSPQVLQSRRILLTEDNKLALTLTHTPAEASDAKTGGRRTRPDRAVFLPNTRTRQGSEAEDETPETEDELDYEHDLAA